MAHACADDPGKKHGISTLDSLNKIMVLPFLVTKLNQSTSTVPKLDCVVQLAYDLGVCVL